MPKATKKLLRQRRLAHLLHTLQTYIQTIDDPEFLDKNLEQLVTKLQFGDEESLRQLEFTMSPQGQDVVDAIITVINEGRTQHADNDDD